MFHSFLKKFNIYYKGVKDGKVEKKKAAPKKKPAAAAGGKKKGGGKKPAQKKGAQKSWKTTQKC